MTAKSILYVVDEYRKARVCFVQTVAELALRANNVDVLRSASTLELLRPLLNDVCPQIQQCAAVAIGRLARHDPSVGQQLLRDDMLDALLQDIERRNKQYKRSAMFVLRSACRHDADVAAAAMAGGGLEALVLCLADHDSQVREAAAWACGYVARHGHSLARSLSDAGVVPHLVLCLQEPELAVRRVAASALADLTRHGADLAQQAADAGAVPSLARSLQSRDERLRRQALMALSCMARHSAAQAEAVVQADVLPGVLAATGHACALVRRNAALLVRDLCKHSLELAQLLANTGGVGALVHAVADEEREVRVAAVTALGHVAGQSPQLATCVLTCGGGAAFSELLCGRRPGMAPAIDSETVCATAWALGQLVRQCPAAVQEIAAVPVRLLELYTGATGDAAEEVRSRCRTALAHCVQGCTSLAALAPLLHTDDGCPQDILEHVLGQMAKILPREPAARRLFVTSGGLRKMQELEAEPGSTTMEYIAMINACFPDEIVRYYTPGYPDSLLDRVEQYVPQVEMGGADTPPDAHTNSL